MSRSYCPHARHLHLPADSERPHRGTPPALAAGHEAPLSPAPSNDWRCDRRLLFLFLALRQQPLNLFAVALGAICAILALLGIVSQTLLPLAARRQFAKAKAILIPQEVEWNEAGIQFRSAHGQGRFDRNQFYRWYADERVVLLSQDTNLYYLLPRRAMKDVDAAQITAALQQAGVPAA
jgi:hypothetical protein